MKRSLLSLLLELPAAELRTAAEAWAVPLRKRTHADNVALVYGAITDRWTFADAFDALPAAARDLLCALATAPTDGLAPDALADGFAGDDVALADALVPLNAAALALRDDNGSIFAPREVATLVAHALRDRAEGDAAPPPLARVIAALDADELADAARLWGVPDVVGNARPGERDRLRAELRRRVALPRVRGEVEAALSPGARRVVAALRESDAPLPLHEAAALACTEPPAARRALLRALTTSLFACHVWVRGERVLVMPEEFRAAVAPVVALPPLAAVSAEAAGSWRHPHALAWDMLTLLRLIEAGTVRPVGGLGTLAEDYPLARAVGGQFWAGVDAAVPPVAPLAFAATLAEAQGLLRETEASGQFTLRLRDPVAWAKQPFAAQTRALFAAWWRLAGWPEGRGVSVALWGVEWPAFRGRLLDALAACGPDQWHALDNLLTRLAAVRPSLLGDEFTAAGGAGQTPPDRDALTRLCAETTLRTALTWFGVVTWGRAGGNRPAIKLTDTGRWLIGGGREPVVRAGGASPLAVQRMGDDALRVGVHHAAPAHLWPLLAFAEAETFGRVATYRITPASLRRALRRGLTVEQIAQFLAGRVGGTLPPGTAERMATWARSLRRVALARAVVLDADDAATRTEAAAALTLAGATVETLPGGQLLVRHKSGPDALAQALHDADFTAMWEGDA